MQAIFDEEGNLRQPTASEVSEHDQTIAAVNDFTAQLVIDHMNAAGLLIQMRDGDTTVGPQLVELQRRLADRFDEMFPDDSGGIVSMAEYIMYLINLVCQMAHRIRGHWHVAEEARAKLAEILPVAAMDDMQMLQRLFGDLTPEGGDGAV